MRRTLIIILLLLFVKLSFADEQRLTTLFKSANGKYSLQYSKKAWRLKDNGRKTLYSIPDRGYTSMTIFISNDGQRLVVIDDFMEGHEIKRRPAITFFQKSHITASYKLTDMVSDTCNISYSIWHTTWSLEDFGLRRNDSTFSLATFEFNEFEFDTFSGQIQKKAKPAIVNPKSLIVFGKFYKGDNEETTMTIAKYIVGQKQLNNQINFKTRSFGKGSWTETLIINDGVDVTPIRFRNSITTNGCLPN